MSEVFNAPDAHVETVRTTDGHRLTVATSPDSGQMAIETGRWRRLKGDSVYQMWAEHNEKVTSVGVIEDLGAGKVMPIPTYGTKVAITVEPEGGSKKPHQPADRRRWTRSPSDRARRGRGGKAAAPRGVLAPRRRRTEVGQWMCDPPLTSYVAPVM